MKRSHGSGHVYVKWGLYYGRWRGVDGRLINKRIGKVRKRGEKDGITRAEAERGLRRLIEVDARRPAPRERRTRTVDEVADELRERLVVEGARLSYRQNCESMQRVHISPAIGKRRMESVASRHVERLGRSMPAANEAVSAFRAVLEMPEAAAAPWRRVRPNCSSACEPAPLEAMTRRGWYREALRRRLRELAEQIAPGQGPATR